MNQKLKRCRKQLCGNHNGGTNEKPTRTQKQNLGKNNCVVTTMVEQTRIPDELKIKTLRDLNVQ